MQIENVASYITDWLTNYASKNHLKGFVIGISGGIDSAVTSTLCARTGLPTLCLEMPIHQPPSHVSRSKEHIDFLSQHFSNITSHTIELTSTFESFKQAMYPVGNNLHLDLTLANTRARLRMVTLYYYAGLHGYIVVGTGNKIEDFGVGFYTKYGDGGVDISPIADLMKSEVYALGHYLGVPDSILKAKPSDGLFGDERSDEDQLGATYDELEWAMNQVFLGKKVDDFTGRNQEVFLIYSRLNKINQHKMNPIPVCLIPNHLKNS